MEGFGAWKGLIAGAVFALCFALERLFPAARAPIDGVRRLRRNAALGVLVLAAGPLIVTPLAAIADAHPLWRRPGDQALLLAFDILALDLWTYALHRAYHGRPLWRLHRVHHLDRHLDSTSAVRFHPGEIALSAVLRLAPIMALAIPFGHVLAFEIALFSVAAFHHSNVAAPRVLERALAWVIVTPSHHWVHHHATRADTASNFGAVFSFWDRLFGTKSRTVRTAEMPIGVEGVEDASLVGLLKAPMSKQGGG